MSDNVVQVPIETIIRGSYVKYDRLSEIVYETYGNSPIQNATVLNIFIDLNSVMHPVFSESSKALITNYTEISSAIINMVGHYRTFFKKLGVITKFFLVFSYNTCDINTKFVAEYNSIFAEKCQIKKYRTIAEDNFKLLELLCPYLPDVFFIRSIRNYEVAVIISHLIDKYGSNIPNLIISRDLYPIQLCTLHSYTSFLRPNKYRSEDISKMISIREKDVFIYDFWKFIADNRRMTDEQFLNTFDIISPLNFPLVMALTGFKDRNIKGAFCQLRHAINLIYSMIQDAPVKILSDQLYSNEYFAQNLPIAIIENRMKALDVTFMRPYYDNDPESKSIKLDNLNDVGAVNTINAKFFKDNPIKLDLL